jgi:hypothetical protein
MNWWVGSWGGSLHIKRIDIEDLVSYVYIVRVDTSHQYEDHSYFLWLAIFSAMKSFDAL